MRPQRQLITVDEHLEGQKLGCWLGRKPVECQWFGPVPDVKCVAPGCGPCRLAGGDDPHRPSTETCARDLSRNRGQVDCDIGARRDRDEVALQVSLDLGDAIQASKAVFDGLDSR